MDLDIEMHDGTDMGHDFPPEDVPQDDILQPDEPEEDGEVAEEEQMEHEALTIVPTKINLQGVDDLHTDDIKAHVKALYGHVDKVEWIDDTSANLVFSSESSARDALVALVAVPIADPTALAPGETLPGKPVESKSTASLQIRYAFTTDRKQAGAAQRSRYYLLHPEHDPEERKRKAQERNRYRDRDGGRGRRRRDSDEQVEKFEASMYDDAPAARPRRHSDSDDRRRQNQGKELFSRNRASMDRDRSASPRRDMDLDQDTDRRPGSAANRASARNVRDRLARGGSNSNSSRELFPGKGSKELFPTKSAKVSQLDALEASIGSAHLSEADMPKIVSAPRAPPRDLFSIKGAASRRDDGPGLTIKGTAASARELFPNRLGGESNKGKELFGAGTRRTRQKAEDLFS